MPLEIKTDICLILLCHDWLMIQIFWTWPSSCLSKLSTIQYLFNRSIKALYILRKFNFRVIFIQNNKHSQEKRNILKKNVTTSVLLLFLRLLTYRRCNTGRWLISYSQFLCLISSKSLQFLSQNGKHPISDVITVVLMYMHSVCIQLYTVKSFKKS